MYLLRRRCVEILSEMGMLPGTDGQPCLTCIDLFLFFLGHRIHWVLGGCTLGEMFAIVPRGVYKVIRHCPAVIQCGLPRGIFCPFIWLFRFLHPREVSIVTLFSICVSACRFFLSLALLRFPTVSQLQVFDFVHKLWVLSISLLRLNLLLYVHDSISLIWF